MLLIFRILYESVVVIVRLPLVLWYVMTFGYGLNNHLIIEAYLEYRDTFGGRIKDKSKMKLLARLHRAALAHERQMISVRKTVANIEYWKSRGFIGYWWMGARVMLLFFVVKAFSAAADEYVSPTLAHNYPVQVEWTDWVVLRPLHWLGRMVGGEQYADRVYPLRDRPDKAIWDSEHQRLISAFSRKEIPYRPGLHIYYADGIWEMDPANYPTALKH